MKNHIKITPPHKLKTYIFLQNYMTMIGLVILLIGQSLSFLDTSRFDVSTLQFFYAEKDELQGKIIAVNPIYYTFSNNHIYGYDYEVYDSELGRSYGTSFANRGDLKVGNKVTVEYLKNNTSTHRIKGMFNSFIIDVTVIYILIILVGLLFVTIGWRNTRRFLMMVKNGYITKAKLSEKPKTRLIEDTRYYEMKFAFQTKEGQGVEIKKLLSNAQNILDDEQEWIIYDENKPSKNYFIDRLPPKLKQYVYDEIR